MPLATPPPVLAGFRGGGRCGAAGSLLAAARRDGGQRLLAPGLLTQYHEATGDPRALELLQNYFAYLRKAPPDWPNKDGRGVRAMENAVTAYWPYRRTGDRHVLEVAASIQKNSGDWIKRWRHP